MSDESRAIVPVGQHGVVASVGRRLEITEKLLAESINHHNSVTVASFAYQESLTDIQAELNNCQRCLLWKDRTNLVFGVGATNAKLVFVGEAPGADDDEQGLPFVGRSGQLLTDIIVKGMKLDRKDVYICNVLKCRPPLNRQPLQTEIAQCQPFLLRQIKAIRPVAIVALGTIATQTLLNSKEPLSKLRGSFYDYHGIPLVPTYHPAYLLVNLNLKKDVWEDIQRVCQLLRKIP
jgi:uracil-DNA glycosylase family 4